MRALITREDATKLKTYRSAPLYKEATFITINYVLLGWRPKVLTYIYYMSVAELVKIIALLTCYLL